MQYELPTIRLEVQTDELPASEGFCRVVRLAQLGWLSLGPERRGSSYPSLEVSKRDEAVGGNVWACVPGRGNVPPGAVLDGVGVRSGRRWLVKVGQGPVGEDEAADSNAKGLHDYGV